MDHAGQSPIFKLDLAMSVFLFFIVVMAVSVFFASAADVVTKQDTLSNQTVSASSSHTVKFTLNADQAFKVGKNIIIDFREDDGAFVVAGAAMTTADVQVAAGAAVKTTFSVTVGAPDCTGSVGAANIAVGVNDATGVVTITPCAGFTQVNGGTLMTIAIGAQAGGTNRITNPAVAGRYFVDITNAAGDCTVNACRMAVPIVSASATTVSGSVEALGGSPSPGDTTPPVISSVAVGGITKNSAVVTWSTNELSNSTVQYGLTIAYGSSATNAGFVIAHTIPLAGLDEATLYNYRVCSRDSSLNEACSPNATFTTTDETPPVISGVAVTVTGSTATVTWTTNENSTSMVDYGLTAGPPYSLTEGHMVIVTAHSVTLTGLTDNTTYNYRVRSVDASSNESFTANATFATTDATAPILSQIQAVSITTTTATITWVTNENADSRVDFGLTDAFGLSQTSAVLTLNHSLSLTGLTPNQEYVYRVTSKDATNNTAVSGNVTFRTTIPAAPTISAIIVSAITQISARVTWTTSTATDSLVQYGTSLPYTSSLDNGVLVTAHVMNLTGLQKGRLYNFRVVSTDAYGQFVESSNRTFSTLADITPPANVSSLNSVPGNSKITLNWTNPVEADFVGVVVRRKTNTFPSGPTDGVEVYSGSGTTVVDEDVTNGVTYYYGVFSYDDVPNYASGAVTSSTPVGPPDVTPPSNVSGFSVRAEDRRVLLRWVNPPEHDFQGVKILRKSPACPTGPSDGILIYQGDAMEFADIGVVNGRAYCYNVFAYDAVPNYASGVTATATPTGVVDTTAPDEVSQFVAIAGPAMVQLAWINPATPDWAGTMIVRKIGSPPSNISDGIIVYNSLDNSKLDVGLTNGLTYFYKAFTYDAVPNYSNGVTVSALPLANLPLPSAPCNDTDGGKNYLVQGTVTAPGSAPVTDSCVDSRSLQEQFCLTPFIASSEHVTCAGSMRCATGRCVAGPPELTAVCGNAVCEDTENSLNCRVDCPVTPHTPPVVSPFGPPAGLLQASDIRFYATSGKIQLRTTNDTRTQAGNRLMIYPTMTFTVMVPDPAIRKPIKAAFVNFDGTSYVMRQTASMEATVISPAAVGSYPLSIVLSYNDNTSDTVDFYTDVSGFGQVFEVVNGKSQPVAGMIVSLFVDTGGGNFGLWPGQLYGERNPQVTGANGVFAFIVPAGTYRLLFEKKGYDVRSTLAFPVTYQNVLIGTFHMLRLPPPLTATPESIKENAQFLIDSAKDKGKEVVQNPIVKQQIHDVGVPTTVIVAAANLASLGTFLPYILSLYTLLTQPAQLFGRRRRKKWGVVYNALTKLPIDLAIVRLLDQTGKVIRSAVTDKDGRYFFIVEIGLYRIVVTKPGFVYPTAFLKDQKEDLSYPDLYHGEAIMVKEEATITANIPLDPLAHEQAPRRIMLESFFRQMQKVISVTSIVFMILAAIITPSVFVFVILGVNVALYLLFRRLSATAQPKSWGIVYDTFTQKPLGSVVARIFETRFNKLLETQVTDTTGRYGFLVGSNQYYVTFEKPGYQKQQKGPIDLSKEKDSAGNVIALDVGLKKDGT